MEDTALDNYEKSIKRKRNPVSLANLAKRTKAIMESDSGDPIPPKPPPDPEAIQAYEVHKNEIGMPFSPSVEMLVFAKTFLSGKHRSLQACATAAKVSPTAVRNWFRDDGFVLWLDEYRRALFRSFRPEIDAALINKARKGSIKHMELFYDLIGDREKTMEMRRIEKVVDSSDVHQQFLILTQTIQSIRGAASLKSPAPTETPKVVDNAEDTEPTEPVDRTE